MGFWRDLGRLVKRYNGFSATFSNPPIPSPGSGGASFSSIDLRRAEASLQSAAVWSSTNLVANVLSGLPLDTYRRKPDGTAQQIPNPQIVDDPGGEGYGAPDWLYQYLMCRQLRGNVVGQLAGADRSTGLPTQIVLYHPDEAYGWRDYQGVRHWTASGRELTSAEMATLFHRRAYPMPGCVMGMSPVAYHFATIGQNVAATRFGLQFFLDSGHPSYVYRNSLEEVNQSKAAAVKERIMATTYGRREPLVMGKGWEKPDALQVSPEDSQMLATQGYSAADCCRLFGPGLAEVLGYETGGSLTYSTRVDRATDLLTFTFDPHLTDLERMFTALLPPGQFVRFNRSALLRMTTMERWRVYLMQLASKARVINEVRDDEDWAPVSWGNEPVEVSPIPAGAGDDGKTKEPPR